VGGWLVSGVRRGSSREHLWLREEEGDVHVRWHRGGSDGQGQVESSAWVGERFEEGDAGLLRGNVKAALKILMVAKSRSARGDVQW